MSTFVSVFVMVALGRVHGIVDLRRGRGCVAACDCSISKDRGAMGMGVGMTVLAADMMTRESGEVY